MTKIISKIGNSHGIIFDSTFMGLARLKPGDKMNVEMHDGGVITFTPVRPNIDAKKASVAARRLIRKNSELFRRLA